MKIRVMIAVCAAKFVGYVCKKMGRQGVTWAGKVAIKICPDILEQLSSQVRKAIFATCGTNGKTTTNNMLCAALEAEGQKVICNHTGSNMLNGVVAAFVLASKWNGKIDADYACIEADEASTRHIFPRIKPDYMLLTNLFRDQLSFCVEGKHIVANYKGFYNVYNILAAYAGVRTAGFAGEHFGDMLRRFNPENGRMEQFRIKGTGVTLNLAKNPAGFNQNISAVMQDQAPKDIIIAINDNAQDGTDISWLWDVDFDLLGNDSVKSITVSGIRCQDMRLRLKYVDIPSVLEGDVEKAIRDRVEDGVGNLYVLVNYTALFSTRNILKRLEGEK